MWYAIRDLVDDDCGFESHGQIQVAETTADLEVLSSRVDHLSSTLSKNGPVHRPPWMWKIVSSRKISWARSMVSLSRPKSPNVRHRPLMSDQ